MAYSNISRTAVTVRLWYTKEDHSSPNYEKVALIIRQSPNVYISFCNACGRRAHFHTRRENEALMKGKRVINYKLSLDISQVEQINLAFEALRKNPKLRSHILCRSYAYNSGGVAAYLLAQGGVCTSIVSGDALSRIFQANALSFFILTALNGYSYYRIRKLDRVSSSLQKISKISHVGVLNAQRIFMQARERASTMMAGDKTLFAQALEMKSEAEKGYAHCKVLNNQQDFRQTTRNLGREVGKIACVTFGLATFSIGLLYLNNKCILQEIRARDLAIEMRKNRSTARSISNAKLWVFGGACALATALIATKKFSKTK